MAQASAASSPPGSSVRRAGKGRKGLGNIDYQRDGVQELNCEVSNTMPNSQGLRLSVDIDQGVLSETHSVNGEVCKWTLSRLHDRLLAKHRETFWISAREMNVDGRICFRLESVRHTRAPSHSAFDRLIAHGHITVDHLIKQNQSGSVVEKGPLFKIAEQWMDDLFLGRPLTYKLSA